MARLRYNGLTATLASPGLTSGATTVTFIAPLTHSGGTAVPTISGGDTIPFAILDAAGVVSEIVNLTAYTTGATTGTITRAQESTTAKAHGAGVRLVHGASVADWTTAAGDLSAHLADTVDAHDASAISVVPAGTIAATDVQAALAELDTEKQALTGKGAANGYASLDAAGLVPTTQLPALAITDTTVVASQAAMLALTAERGDVAIRSDLSKSFILAAEPASTLANWKELATPTDTVLSVAGKTGAVSLVESDVTGLVADLAAKLDAAQKAAASGVAPLDAGSRVPEANLPAGLAATALSATYGRRRQYDVRDYLGADDIGAAINRAIAAAAADGHGYGKPGQVIIPPGEWTQTTEINPVNGVDLFGSGWGKTVLKPQGYIASIDRIGSVGSPLTDCHFANFEIDGSAQAHSTPGSYDSSMKGFTLIHTLRCKFEHLYIHHTGSTGLGIDFLRETVIDDVLAAYCGRLNPGTGPGGAGIGIAVGASGIEACSITNSVTRNNGRYGLFFEAAGGIASVSGYRVTNHESHDNASHGIADCGASNLQIIGGESRNNGGSGFYVGKGSVEASWGGVHGRIAGLHLVANTGHGIHIDSSVVAGGSDYKIDSVKSRSNGQRGIFLQGGVGTLTGVTITNNECSTNNDSGIEATGGAITYLEVSGNRCFNNGQNAGAASRDGIAITGGVDELRAVNNRCYDRQGTKTQQYGFRMNGYSYNGVAIDGNDLRGNAAGPVFLSGSISAAGVYVGRNNGYTVTSGTPEAAVKAPVGTVFTRTDGGAATTLYVKESGGTGLTSNTGWVAK